MHTLMIGYGSDEFFRTHRVGRNAPMRNEANRRETIEQEWIYAWKFCVLYDKHCAHFSRRWDIAFLFSARECACCDRSTAHHHDRLHDIMEALVRHQGRKVNCREDRHCAYAKAFSSDSAPLFQNRAVK